MKSKMKNPRKDKALKSLWLEQAELDKLTELLNDDFAFLTQDVEIAKIIREAYKRGDLV